MPQQRNINRVVWIVKRFRLLSAEMCAVWNRNEVVSVHRADSEHKTKPKQKKKMTQKSWCRHKCRQNESIMSDDDDEFLWFECSHRLNTSSGERTTSQLWSNELLWWLNDASSMFYWRRTKPFLQWILIRFHSHRWALCSVLFLNRFPGHSHYTHLWIRRFTFISFLFCLSLWNFNCFFFGC